MPPKELLKYILDIESLIEELENVISLHSRDLSLKKSNDLSITTMGFFVYLHL